MNSDVKVVQPSGILDSTKSDQFKAGINEVLNNGANTVLVDFQDVSFMDSSGLGALVIALKTVRASGGDLFVCSINDQIKILFELTSMDKVFRVFDDRDAFYRFRLGEKVPTQTL